MESRAPLIGGFAVFILLFQLFAFGLLAGGPRVTAGEGPEHCVWNARINAWLGHSLNCDSYEFIRDGADPENVFGPEGKRQSRPGAALFVYAVSRPLLLLFGTLQDDPGRIVAFMDMGDGGERYEIRAAELAASYAAYMFLHILILGGAAALYLRTLGLRGKAAFDSAAGLAALAVMVNNISKQFLWSPHTQLFNVLAPLLAVFLFRALQTAKNPVRVFMLAALACGAGMLFYGVFAVPAAVAGLGLLWRERAAIRGSLRRAARTAGVAVAGAVLFAVPYALWYGFIVLHNGAFFNYDVEVYRGFAWLPETWARYGAEAVSGHFILNFYSFMKGAFLQGAGYIAVLVALVLVVCRRAPDRGMDAEALTLWLGAGCYIFLAALFYSLYGLTVLRLSCSAALAVLPVMGFYLQRFEQLSPNPFKIRRITVAVLCAYTVFMVVKLGPYS